MPRRNTGAKLKWFPDRGAWYITWTVNHRSRKRSTGTTSREEADLLLAEFLQTRSRTAAGASDPSKVLITDCLTLYAEERGPDVIGKETLGRAIVNLTAFWTENVVIDVTPQTCKRYATARGVGDGTVRRELGVLQAATNHAFKEGRITRLDLVHMHFNGLTVEEAMNVDHPAIRDSDLRIPSYPPSADSEDEGCGKASNGQQESIRLRRTPR
jgi:hypothetical protein